MAFFQSYFLNHVSVSVVVHCSIHNKFDSSVTQILGALKLILIMYMDVSCSIHLSFLGE